jgi:hypothetical protein
MYVGQVMVRYMSLLKRVQQSPGKLYVEFLKADGRTIMSFNGLTSLSYFALLSFDFSTKAVNRI